MRPREYDRQKVMERAMAQFWAHGFHGTSIQDLTQEMGMNRSSIYSSFENKKELFLEALKHYGERVIQRRISYIEKADTVKEGLERFFDDLIEQSVQGKGLRGCLITNSVTELSLHDEAVARVLKDYMSSIEEIFYRSLCRAQRNGELSPDRDPRSLAPYFVGVMNGINVLGTLMPQDELLQNIRDEALSVFKDSRG